MLNDLLDTFNWSNFQYLLGKYFPDCHSFLECIQELNQLSVGAFGNIIGVFDVLLQLVETNCFRIIEDLRSDFIPLIGFFLVNLQIDELLQFELKAMTFLDDLIDFYQASFGLKLVVWVEHGMEFIEPVLALLLLVNELVS